ncbi:MAG: DUF2063 domain-containing protein [Methylococcaceae bacterium]|nr:DUF2063 domain-containing protein [Methylococcaceae bacterium]
MTQSSTTQNGSSTLPAFQAYQYQFTRYLRNPGNCRLPPGVSAKHIGIYAELFRNKIEDSLLSCFPITRELLGKRHWSRLIRRFIAQHRCESQLYRQIPDEFIAFLQNERSNATDPPFLMELAHYEWMELVLSVGNEAVPEAGIQIDGDWPDGQVVFAPALQLLRYAFPVHRISAELSGWQKWKSWRRQPLNDLTEQTFLLGFRNRFDDVRFLEINPATARLIELLADQHLSGRQALMRLSRELGAADPQAIATFGIDVLNRLKNQDAILGVRATSSTQT